MTIWCYKAFSRVPSVGAFFALSCIFCGAELERYSDVSGTMLVVSPSDSDWRSGRNVGVTGGTSCTVCPCCGWWTLLHAEEMESRRGLVAIHRGAIGSLMDIDTDAARIPIQEVRRYLLARWEARASVDWRVMEETVGAVFRDIGFESRVTSRSNDGGLDVILSDSSGSVVGVQVKRYKESISAQPIQALLGALVNHGLTAGIFVTTSSFQPSAKREATLAESRGYRIDLVDGEALYDLLGIAQHRDVAGVLDGLPSVYETRRLWRSPLF